jgi:MFS family permease
MQDDTKPKLSGRKRLLGLAALVMVIGGSMWFGSTVAHRLGGQPSSSPPVAVGPLASVLLAGLGIIILLLGAGAYAVMVATGAMTFTYSKPLFRGLKVRLWVVNLLVGLMLQCGLALVVAPMLVQVVAQLLPLTVAFPLCFFGPFILAQFAFIWFQIWGPLERIVIARRLRAEGIPDTALADGIYVGISDPSKNSFKKLSLVEDDVGMLWFGPERLIYRGDSMAWQVARGHLLAVDQRADAGSASSYFGAVHVIIRFRDENGTEQTWRLHSEGDWTMTRRARSLDRLAAALESWREGAMPVLNDRPVGFDVTARSS